MQNAPRSAALLLLACFWLPGVLGQTQECREDKDQDEVFLLQVGAGDVEHRKALSKPGHQEKHEESAENVYPVAHESNHPVAHKGVHPAAQKSEHPVAHSPKKIEQLIEEQVEQQVRVQIEAANTKSGVGYGKTLFGGILTGILRSAREKLDSLAIFLAHETQEMNLKMRELNETIGDPAKKLNKKAEKWERSLINCIKFLMSLLISVLVLAFLVLCVISCVLLVNWRIQVAEEEERSARGGGLSSGGHVGSNDLLGPLGNDSGPGRVSQGNIHHRPFQGQARRLAPDQDVPPSAGK